MVLAALVLAIVNLVKGNSRALAVVTIIVALVPLVMVAQMNAQTGKLFVRNTTLYAATVLDPEKCGVIVANQT